MLHYSHNTVNNIIKLINIKIFQFFIIKLIVISCFNCNSYATINEETIVYPKEKPPTYQETFALTDLQQPDNQLPNYDDVNNLPPNYYETMQNIFLNEEQIPNSIQQNQLLIENSNSDMSNSKIIILVFATAVVSFTMLFIPIFIYINRK